MTAIARMLEVDVKRNKHDGLCKLELGSTNTILERLCRRSRALPNGDFIGDFGDPSHQLTQNQPWNFNNTGAVFVEVNHYRTNSENLDVSSRLVCLQNCSHHQPNFRYYPNAVGNSKFNSVKLKPSSNSNYKCGNCNSYLCVRSFRSFILHKKKNQQLQAHYLVYLLLIRNVTTHALFSILCLVLNREPAENLGRSDKAATPTYFNT